MKFRGCVPLDKGREILLRAQTGGFQHQDISDLAGTYVEKA